MPIASPIPFKIEIAAQPTEADREPILGELLVYNEANGGPANYEPFAIRLRDTATGASVGGLWARIYYEWLYVDLLYVPEEARGRDVGSKLLCQGRSFCPPQGLRRHLALYLQLPGTRLLSEARLPGFRQFERPSEGREADFLSEVSQGRTAAAEEIGFPRGQTRT